MTTNESSSSSSSSNNTNINNMSTHITTNGTTSGAAPFSPSPPSPPHQHQHQQHRKPTNALVTAMLTDTYQITMAYAYWKNKKHNDPAVFELFFRKCPFQGEYTIFAGLDECLAHLHHFQFTQSDIDYLKTVPSLQHCDVGFFDWLRDEANMSQGVRVYAMKDGTVCFPRTPLITIEAPLAMGQLLETTLLTLVNYPSLVTTNAARMVQAVQHKQLPCGSDKESLPPQCTKTPICVEFGLRRAQGPDGGVSASKYSQMGGFSGTSNVQAGKLCGDGVTLTGTHAHAFVQSYSSLDEVKDVTLAPNKSSTNTSNGNKEEPPPVALLPLVLEYRSKAKSLVPSTVPVPRLEQTNDGELAAFIAYAAAFPHSFLALIDTYDTLSSGLWNFILVALVLDDLGYTPLGVRLDSGDLASLSNACARTFQQVGRHLQRDERFTNDLSIVASNDLNEKVLHQLHNPQSSSSSSKKSNNPVAAITAYGIGTNLVTCQAQPALGCVYKLVELNGQPRIKLSQDFGKILIPGRKVPYRLYDQNDVPILDVLALKQQPSSNGGDGHGDHDGGSVPVAGQAILCRDAFNPHKRVRVIPSRVEPLHALVFDGTGGLGGGGGGGGDVVQPKWLRYKCDDDDDDGGNTVYYFYNTETGETQWEEPAEGFVDTPPQDEDKEEEAATAAGGGVKNNMDTASAATAMKSAKQHDDETQQREHYDDDDVDMEDISKKEVPASAPTIAAAASRNSGSSSDKATASKWVRYQGDDGGDDYYYNTDTQATQWEVPEKGFIEAEECEAAGAGGDTTTIDEQQQRDGVGKNLTKEAAGAVVGSSNRTLIEAKAAVQEQLRQMESLHILRYESPKRYKVSVTSELYDFMHHLWQREAPVKELS